MEGTEDVLERLRVLEAYRTSVETDINIGWLVVSTALVFFMQAGFSMLEIGSCSQRHTKNLLLKNLLDTTVAAPLWWIFGHGIAFGSGGTRLFGFSDFFTTGDLFDTEGAHDPANGYNYAVWSFQCALAGAAVTVASGAVGERITLSSYLLVSASTSGFIYPVLARWSWHSMGWASPWSDDGDSRLFGCGAIDFAGSGVVHMTGGLIGFMLALAIGPRLDRFSIHGDVKDLPKQSAVLQTLGTFMLWLGWIGFNCGSTLYLVGLGHVAAKVLVNTLLASCTAGLATVTLGVVVFFHTSPEETNNGILAGLVAITAACSVVEPEAACIIGAVAAPLQLYASKWLLSKHIDDLVDATPVHFICGIWGVIAPGLFATQESYGASYYSDRQGLCAGILYGGPGNQLAANVVLILAIIAWVSAVGSMIIYPLYKLNLLRISKKFEVDGTDLAAHGGQHMNEVANPNPVPCSSQTYLISNIKFQRSEPPLPAVCSLEPLL
ncbi:unnamed protein product [Chrysoparadoxa australica]